MGAGPAVHNELVGGVVLQPQRGPAVTEVLADVRQDLVEKLVEVENRADSLGYALEKKQLPDPLFVLVVHRTVRGEPHLSFEGTQLLTCQSEGRRPE
jgi:hypothetical protein